MKVDTIPKTMRAAVYRGVDDVRIETIPVPRVGPQEMLVKVAMCGVCPTDIKKIKYGTVEPPRVFGHETSGTIVRMGALVRGFHVGDRVGLHHHVPCMDCHACRHRSFAQCSQYKRTGITAGFDPAGGGYAEYVRVMHFVLPGVVKIPAGNSFEEGAMLEPVNTVMKGIQRLGLLPGDIVLVIGLGPVGLLFTGLLKAQGIEVAGADLLEQRLSFARRFGAKWVTHGAALNEVLTLLPKRRSLDAVVVTVPSDELVRTAHGLVRNGGRVLLFAHTTRGGSSEIDLARICVDERDVVGSYSSDFTLQKMVAEMVFSRHLPVHPLVTDRFRLERISEAIDLAAVPRANSLKIFVDLQT